RRSESFVERFFINPTAFGQITEPPCNLSVEIGWVFGEQSKYDIGIKVVHEAAVRVLETSRSGADLTHWGSAMIFEITYSPKSKYEGPSGGTKLHHVDCRHGTR